MGGGVDVSATSTRLTGLTHRHAEWRDLRVLVAGNGVSGFAAADALLERGALVTVVDGQAPLPGSVPEERARILDILGATAKVFGIIDPAWVILNYAA